MTPKDNKIGNGKTTSLSEALKTNTSLTKLDLGSKHKKETQDVNDALKQSTHFHSHQINRQQD